MTVRFFFLSFSWSLSPSSTRIMSFSSPFVWFARILTLDPETSIFKVFAWISAHKHVQNTRYNYKHIRNCFRCGRISIYIHLYIIYLVDTPIHKTKAPLIWIYFSLSLEYSFHVTVHGCFVTPIERVVVGLERRTKSSVHVHHTTHSVSIDYHDAILVYKFIFRLLVDSFSPVRFRNVTKCFHWFTFRFRQPNINFDCSITCTEMKWK